MSAQLEELAFQLWMRFGGRSFCATEPRLPPASTDCRRVTVVGEHKYDQFERHKDELAQLISRGKTQVSKRVPAECGDAFRQETHKKGAALNGTAWGLDLMVDF